MKRSVRVSPNFKPLGQLHLINFTYARAETWIKKIGNNFPAAKIGKM